MMCPVDLRWRSFKTHKTLQFFAKKKITYDAFPSTRDLSRLFVPARRKDIYNSKGVIKVIWITRLNRFTTHDERIEGKAAPSD